MSLDKKKSVVVVCDVKGWGGWERGQMIQRHLGDEFNIDLVDVSEFTHYVRFSDGNFFNMNDVREFAQTASTWNKTTLKLEEFYEWVKMRSKNKKKYNLYYFLFHTMLASQEAKKMLYDKQKVVTAVTGFPVAKDIFINEDKPACRNPVRGFKNLANQCVAITANNMIALNQLGEMYHGKKFYTPRGVDPEIFYSEREYDDGRPFTAAYVGKPVPEKGLVEIIKPACERAGVKLITNTRNYTDALSKDDMRKLYNQAHVYLVASTIDGTPNPALEASACCRPVIANAIGNMPEFIKDGVNGFLVPERGISHYASRLETLKNDMKLGRKMGNEARKTVLEGWTWKHSMEYERRMLRELLQDV